MDVILIIFINNANNIAPRILDGSATVLQPSLLHHLENPALIRNSPLHSLDATTNKPLFLEIPHFSRCAGMDPRYRTAASIQLSC